MDFGSGVDNFVHLNMHTWLETKHCRFPILINTVQLYQSHFPQHVRIKKNSQSIPNMKKLSGQEFQKWHHAEMRSQAGRHKKTDDWLSGSLWDSLIITRSTQPLSLLAPLGGIARVWSTKQGKERGAGVKRGSLGPALLWRGAWKWGQHIWPTTTPLYKPIHSILNYNACTFYPYVTFP